MLRYQTCTLLNQLGHQSGYVHYISIRGHLQIKTTFIFYIMFSGLKVYLHFVCILSLPFKWLNLNQTFGEAYFILFFYLLCLFSPSHCTTRCQQWTSNSLPSHLYFKVLQTFQTNLSNIKKVCKIKLNKSLKHLILQSISQLFICNLQSTSSIETNVYEKNNISSSMLTSPGTTKDEFYKFCQSSDDIQNGYKKTCRFM